MSSNSEILREIEEIKSRLINLESTLIETEKPTKEDAKAVKQALDDYKKGRTTPYKS